MPFEIPMLRPALVHILLLLGLLTIGGDVAAGQVPVAAPVSPQPGLVASTVDVERSSQPATLVFFNRPIVTLRARVLGREPAERAAGARRMLEDLVEGGNAGIVQSQALGGLRLIQVGSRGVVALTTLDVDELSGETLDGVAARTVMRLQQALREAEEAHTPRELIRAAAAACVAILLTGALLVGLVRAHRFIARKLIDASERRVTKAGIASLGVLRASRVFDFQRHIVTALITGLDLFLIYAAMTFVLRQFPYTRPWGESMSVFLLTTIEDFSLGMAHAMPRLFTIFLIFALTRFVVRLMRLWFAAVESGQVRPLWLHPDTVQPTRRLVTALLWMFASVVAYPYVPGSDSDAFKGVSVFLGLMITFGSSGLVNQIASGFMVTYSRALRVGDFVRIGDVEGTVAHLGVLSTRIMTVRREEVTVPNAVVASQTTTDYSRLGDVHGVFTETSVTIGFDTPWRQVQALLLMAAERTPGLRTDPKPVVLQEALGDFYVKYNLWVCLERQETRPLVLNALHAHIQDLFNEHSVQIMSPHYMFDPAAPKIVARPDWFAAPARPDAEPGGRAG
jgi:small-conductance mechanosensitive channel